MENIQENFQDLVEQQNEEEVLLSDNSFRYTIFPIIHHDLWEMYIKAKASFWSVEEIDLSKDIADWEGMTSNERIYIKHVLAFFAASDTLVNMNLLENVTRIVKIPEANYFYTFQMAVENIHSETYSMLIDTYIRESEEKAFLFNAISTLPAIKKKADWTLKYIQDKSISFGELIVVFIAVEGILFSSSFAALFWLKQRNKMPGLTFSNELISRDEGLHCEFACLLFNRYIVNKPSQERCLEILKSAVDLEIDFTKDAVPVSLLGMSCENMCTYIKFVANRWALEIGLPKPYTDNITNPFPFMEAISLEGKTNFFEKRVGEYRKFGNGDNSFTLDADF